MSISKRIKYTLALSISTFLVLIGASAMAAKQCAPREEDPEGGDDQGVEVTGDCGSTEATVKYYLQKAGYDTNAVAGFLGNFSSESCGFKYKVYCNCSTIAPDDFVAYEQVGEKWVLNSKMTKNCGFGLVQWTPDSNPKVDRLIRLQKYANGQGGSVTDLKIQVQFIIREVATTEINSYYSKVLSPEKLNGRTIEDTTWRIYKWYEAPASSRNSPGYGAVNQACNDSSSSWCKAFTKRLGRAKESLSIDVSTCDPSSEPSTGEEGGDDSDTGSPDPVTIIDPGESTEGPTVTQTTGALGKDSAKDAISQTDDAIKKTQWLPSSSSSSKRIGINDNMKDCCGSGCSLVAVANAYGAIHNYSSSQTASFANSLAEWTKGNINKPSEENTKKIISRAGMTYEKVWSSKGESVEKKITAIRNALASGGAIVAGGDREGTGSISNYCDRLAKSLGKCVFTPGGHYIAIIGITADDKLVVANPGKSNDRTWIFPASYLLNDSNIGYMVK